MKSKLYRLGQTIYFSDMLFYVKNGGLTLASFTKLY
ncbi:MAG: hypothetical protein RLZZ597_517 [Cyanobacteriota bacterium]|jgi:hypothetical protein